MFQFQQPETPEFQDIQLDLDFETSKSPVGADDPETETFYVDGFTGPYNLAGLRRCVMQYANKFHNQIGNPETNILNGKKFYLKYLTYASQDDVKALRHALRKSYVVFLNKIIE